MLSLSAVTGEEDHPLKNEDESGRRLCEYWRTILQARVGDPGHHQHKDFLRYVQQAPDDIRWTVDQTEVDDFHALKKDSAPGPDGTPRGAYRCAGGLGSKILSMLVEQSLKEVLFLLSLLKHCLYPQDLQHR